MPFSVCIDMHLFAEVFLCGEDMRARVVVCVCVCVCVCASLDVSGEFLSRGGSHAALS